MSACGANEGSEDSRPACRLATFTYPACVPRFILPLGKHDALAEMLYRNNIGALLHQHQTFTLALLTESLRAHGAWEATARTRSSPEQRGVDSAWSSRWLLGQRMKGGRFGVRVSRPTSDERLQSQPTTNLLWLLADTWRNASERNAKSTSFSTPELSERSIGPSHRSSDNRCGRWSSASN